MRERVKARREEIVRKAAQAFRERGLAHYAASKAGVEGLARALALELGPHGVRINAIAPRLTTDTRMLDELVAEDRTSRRGCRAAEAIPAAKLGAVYPPAGVRRFLSIIGKAGVQELLLTGGRIDAARARALDIVHRVVAPEAIDGEASRWEPGSRPAAGP